MPLSPEHQFSLTVTGAQVITAGAIIAWIFKQILLLQKRLTQIEEHISRVETLLERLTHTPFSSDKK